MKQGLPDGCRAKFDSLTVVPACPEFRLSRGGSVKLGSVNRRRNRSPEWLFRKPPRPALRNGRRGSGSTRVANRRLAEQRRRADGRLTTSAPMVDVGNGGGAQESPVKRGSSALCLARRGGVVRRLPARWPRVTRLDALGRRTPMFRPLTRLLCLALFALALPLSAQAKTHNAQVHTRCRSRRR